MRIDIFLNRIYLYSFGANFQTTFVVCFSFLTNYRLKYVKLKYWISNSVDPDETAHMSRLIRIYAVCKSLLLSPVAVKVLINIRLPYSLLYFFKLSTSPFFYLWVNLNCRMSGKQYRSRSDAAVCGVWFGAKLFTRACLSKYSVRTHGNLIKWTQAPTPNWEFWIPY